MGTHWYAPSKAGSGYAVLCSGCGHVASQAPTEIEAQVEASRINQEIADSFRPDMRPRNPASYGLSRRMRLAKKARK